MSGLSSTAVDTLRSRLLESLTQAARSAAAEVRRR